MYLKYLLFDYVMVDLYFHSMMHLNLSTVITVVGYCGAEMCFLSHSIVEHLGELVRSCIEDVNSLCPFSPSNRQSYTIFYLMLQLSTHLLMQDLWYEYYCMIYVDSTYAVTKSIDQTYSFTRTNISVWIFLFCL